MFHVKQAGTVGVVSLRGGFGAGNGENYLN